MTTIETTWQATGTVLDRILAQTSRDLADRKAATTTAELERMAADRPAPHSLASAIGGPGVAVIAEVKRGSPSRGLFPVAIDVADVAANYVAGGAAAISVLTEGPSFYGTLAELDIVAGVVREATPPRPVLRKDFMVDEYQILESRAYGADVILLIAAALDDPTLARLHAAALDLGLSVLVEVHDAGEMARAAAIGASIIGINNRDLRDFRVDLATTEHLAPLAPAGALLVGESGIFTSDDVERLGVAGVNAVLVGESLILSDDRAAGIRLLRRGQPNGI